MCTNFAHVCCGKSRQDSELDALLMSVVHLLYAVYISAQIKASHSTKHMCRSHRLCVPTRERILQGYCAAAKCKKQELRF